MPNNSHDKMPDNTEQRVAAVLDNNWHYQALDKWHCKVADNYNYYHQALRNENHISARGGTTSHHKKGQRLPTRRARRGGRTTWRRWTR